MPSRDARAGRAETRTPEPPDREEHQKSPPGIRPKRTIKRPSTYAQEQEEEAARHVLGSQNKTRGRGRPKTRSETAAERVDSSEDEPETGNCNPDTTELLAELVKLRREIKRRDEIHREELRKVKAEFAEALAGVQQELAELRNGLTTSQSSSETGSQTSHEEILQELHSIRTAITTPIPADGPSWASIVAGGPGNGPNTGTLATRNKKSQTKELTCLRISTRPGPEVTDSVHPNTFMRRLSPGAAISNRCWSQLTCGQCHLHILW